MASDVGGVLISLYDLLSSNIEIEAGDSLFEPLQPLKL